MPTEPVVSRVDPVDFDWSAGSGPAADVRRVLDDAIRADGRSPVNEATLLALRHGLEGATLHVTGRGSLTGFAFAHGRPGTHQPVDLNVAVSPSSRGSGQGHLLTEAALAGLDRSAVSAWSHGNHPAAARLADAFGFDRVRELWKMRRPLGGDLGGDRGGDLPPPPPAGSTVVRAFRPGQDEEAFLRVNAAAFAHHPEQGSMTRADLEERMAEPWFDPDGFFLAVDETGELLGYHWTKVHPDTAAGRVGEVYVVGVGPHAQGKGLGKLLTLTGLHHLAGRGLDEVVLFVEADNAPAVAVYTGLGFTHAEADTDVQYLRPAQPSA